MTLVNRRRFLSAIAAAVVATASVTRLGETRVLPKEPDYGLPEGETYRITNLGDSGVLTVICADGTEYEIPPGQSVKFDAILDDVGVCRLMPV